jgi:hypothetical protein
LLVVVFVEKNNLVNGTKIGVSRGGMGRYWNLMEDSRGTLGCPERGLARGLLRVILGCTDRKWSSQGYLTHLR